MLRCGALDLPDALHLNRLSLSATLAGAGKTLRPYCQAEGEIQVPRRASSDTPEHLLVTAGGGWEFPLTPQEQGRRAHGTPAGRREGWAPLRLCQPGAVGNGATVFLWLAGVQ